MSEEEYGHGHVKWDRKIDENGFTYYTDPSHVREPCWAHETETEWIEVFDKESGHVYLEHHATGETKWKEGSGEGIGTSADLSANTAIEVHEGEPAASSTEDAEARVRGEEAETERDITSTKEEAGDGNTKEAQGDGNEDDAQRATERDAAINEVEVSLTFVSEPESYPPSAPPLGESTIWEELVDQDSGAHYWYSNVSKSSQWGAPLWVDCADESSSAIYYLNTTTYESTWDKPEEFQDHAVEQEFEYDEILQCYSPKSRPPSSHDNTLRAKSSTLKRTGEFSLPPPPRDPKQLKKRKSVLGNLKIFSGGNSQKSKQHMKEASNVFSPVLGTQADNANGRGNL